MPFGGLKLLGQFLHRLLVERCLLAAELAEGLHLGLVGQVRNDRLVGLQPPQNVRPHQLAERAVRVVGPLRQTFDQARKLLRRPEQARVDEVEDGPQVAQPVLDRRTGERKSCLGVQFLGGAGLLGFGILDGLSFVEHHQAPRGLRQPREAEERTVAGNDQVHIAEPFGFQRFEFGRRDHGGMGD